MNWDSNFIHEVSFLLKLIAYAEENNIDINKTSVKGAICIGEPLKNQDFHKSRRELHRLAV